MTTTGTGYFLNLHAALCYYDTYGIPRREVEAKLTRGEIHVGLRPPCKEGETVYLHHKEFRYFIRSEK